MKKAKEKKIEKPGKESEEVALLKNQLARALADYDNLRKRVDSESQLWIKFSSERVLIKLFPIIDILESAQEHLKDQGLAIAILEFKKVLKEEGIEEINPKVGDEFNPEVHEAVEAIEASSPASSSDLRCKSTSGAEQSFAARREGNRPGGGKKGTIAELVLPGWKFEASSPEGSGPEGKLIRVAKVKVYGENTEKKEELEKEMARGDYM